jgi:hypothetical protein
MKFKNILIALISAPMLLALNAAHAWTINMDFNQGALGERIYDSGNGYDVFSGAAGQTFYSDCAGNAQDGQCAIMNINKGDDGWGTWGGRIKFREKGLPYPVVGDEVWISVKVFMPIGFDYDASPHLKFLRLHTKSVSVSNEGYNDLYIKPSTDSRSPYTFIREAQGIGRRFGDVNTDRPKLGTWETYEMYYKMDNVSVADGGTGRVRIWKNGKLLAEHNDVQTLMTADSFADAFLIFTYWNGGTSDGTGAFPRKDQHLFVDDLIITTDTPSNRDIFGNVMIGDILSLPKAPTALAVN